jgi:hypothetical protein
MYRTILFAASALVLVGCSSPCEEAAAAIDTCLEEASAPVSTSDDVCEGDDGEDDAFYECIISAYETTDCSDAEGATEAAVAAAKCDESSDDDDSDTDD